MRARGPRMEDSTVGVGARHHGQPIESASGLQGTSPLERRWRKLSTTLVLAGSRIAGVSVAFCVLVGVAVTWLVQSSVLTVVAGSQLQVDPTCENFGTVWEQSDFRWRLKIHNSTRNEIKIARFITSCNCAAVEPESLALPPGKWTEVLVKLDLRSFNEETATDGAQEFATQIIPVLKGTKPPHPAWIVRGEVRRAFRVQPRFLTFGEALVEGEPFPSGMIRVVPLANVSNFDAKSTDPQVASVEVETTTEPCGYLIRVCPDPSVSAGLYRFHVAVTANSESCNSTVRASIPVVVRVLPDLQIVPPSLSFGILQSDECIEETIVLRSRTGKAFELVGIEVQEGEGVFVEPLMHSEAEASFRVRQVGVAPRSQNSVVRFIVEQACVTLHHEAILRINYYGVDFGDKTEH